MYSSIVFTIGLFCYMYMHYKRLFLNWIKQRDPKNIFETCLQSNNRTLKSHVKQAPCFDHLILCNSFSWIHTNIGFLHWDQLYCDWLDFYREWIRNHQNSKSYEL